MIRMDRIDKEQGIKTRLKKDRGAECPRKETGEHVPAILLAIVLLILWQIASVAAGIPHIFPSPLQIVVRTWELRESLLLHHLPPTLVTIAAGWGLSVLIGTVLAFLMYRHPFVEAMIHPVLVITQTIPVMCISPLFVLWFGYTVAARLLAVVLSTFFTITWNIYAGLQGTDRQKLELLYTYGAGRWECFRRLLFPSALPSFFTGLKLTFPWAVVDAAAAEWLGANSGLGYFSRRMISAMDGPAVFAPILVLCLIAWIGMFLLRIADRKLAYYRNELS